jgi:hypothetical protein
MSCGSLYYDAHSSFLQCPLSGSQNPFHSRSVPILCVSGSVSPSLFNAGA